MASVLQLQELPFVWTQLMFFLMLCIVLLLVVRTRAADFFVYICSAPSSSFHLGLRLISPRSLALHRLLPAHLAVGGLRHFHV